MKKIVLKLLVGLFLLTMCLMSVGMAETMEKAGLSVTLTTDKASYSEGELMKVFVTVKNNGKNAVGGGSMMFDVPQTCVSVKGTDLTIGSLKPGETAEYEAEFKVASNGMTAAQPHTGDNSNILAWAAAALICTAACLGLKKKRIAALMLSIVFTGISTAAFESAGTAESSAGSSVLRVSKKVMILGKEQEISFVIEMNETDGKSSAKHVLNTFAGKNLWETTTSNTKTVYSKQYYYGVALPQSNHYYGNNVDELYYLRTPKRCQINLKFSGNSKVENDYDLLLVYDADGNYIAGYTGTEMSNKQVSVTSNGVYIRLLSDSSVSYYGFAVSDVTPLTITEFSSCYNNGKGGIVLKWQNPAGATSYQIQRAIVKADGTAGSYTTIKTGKRETSYTDTTCKLGYRYRYRIRHNTTGYGSETIYVFKTTAITSVSSKVLNSVPIITLNWNAVNNGSKYEIWRSESKNGTYQYIGYTRTTNYSDNPPQKKVYYYKIRPYAQVRGEEYATFYSAPKAAGFAQTPAGLSAYGAGTKSVTLTWSSAPGAYGYVVYRSTSPNGTYTKVGETTTALKLTDSKAASGKVNYYKIRSYLKIANQRVYSEYSSPIGVYPMTKVTGVLGRRVSNTSVSLSWKEVAGAQKYAVYYSYSKSGPFTLAKTVYGTTTSLTGLNEDYEYVYVQIRAQRLDGSVKSITSVANTVKIKKNPQTLRTLYIIEEDFPGKESDRPNMYATTTQKMANMLKKGTPGGLTVAAKFPNRNLTYNQILRKIDQMAGYADDNDITLFVMSSHGSSNGMVVTSDNYGMSMATLANALNKIKGRVVVILDFCYSGNAINKGMEEKYAKEMTEQVIDAFAAIDSEIVISSNDDMGDVSKSGEMCTNKFFVITSAQGNQYSWRNNNGTFLMQWMNEGVMGADSNRDNKVTLKEMGAYLQKKGRNTQFWDEDQWRYVNMIPQVYPNNSSFGLFIK